MSYLVQSRMAEDAVLLRRVAACAASEGVDDPMSWAYRHQWVLSAQPGWVGVYKYAFDSGDDDPGGNEAAITDGMILSAVQSILGIEVPGPEPESPEPEPEPVEPVVPEEPEPEEQDPSQ